MPETIFLSPRPDDPDAAADGNAGASEFLSEASEEFKALKQTTDFWRVPEPRAAATDSAADVVRLVPPLGPALSPPVTRSRRPWLIAVAVAAVALPVYFLWQRDRVESVTPAEPATAAAVVPPAPLAAAIAPVAPPPGTAIVESNPPGAEVTIDGQVRGTTPLRLSLPAGVYSVELKQGSATKTITMSVDAGTTLRESVELPAAVPGTGRLSITSDTAGARVMLDGRSVGVTPLSLSGITPGAHRVAVTTNGQTVTRSVTVERGATASVYLASTPAAASGGWVTIDVPFEMRVMDRDQVIGTTSAPRIMLPVGRHELELAATRFDFRTGVVVEVQPGQTTTVQVPVPNGRLSLNAVPWADVWLDGQSVGQTPIANLAVPIGVHTIVWRHPQFGERQQSVTVTTDAPARVGVDLTSAP